jgi:hypothetical protein
MKKSSKLLYGTPVNIMVCEDKQCCMEDFDSALLHLLSHDRTM